MKLPLLTNLSIKQKLTLMTLTSIIAGVVLIGIFFLFYERIQMRKQLAHEVSVVSKVAHAQLKVALIFDDEITLQETANSLDFDGTVDRVCIYGDDLSLKAHSYPDSVDLPPCFSSPLDVDIGFVGGKYFFREDIYSEGDRVGTLLIQSNLSNVNQQIKGYSYIVLNTLAIVSAISFLVAMVLQRAVTTPLSNLARVAAQVAENSDYAVRASKMSNDELGQVVDAFNTMLSTIEQRNNELKAHKADLETTVQERTAELRAANQELEAFSFSVSHDLRSPLRAIDGFSQALLEDYGEQLDSTAQGYLDRVRLASQRMGILIDSMLRLSRVTRQEMTLSNANLSEICEEIVEELRERNPNRAMEITIQPEMSATCDVRLIRIALNNLLDNAWKYTRTKEPATIVVSCADGVYCVRDNGAGFDMRYADKLFGAFQRLHSNEELEGTGVGLATVARVISRHSGEIWARSKVNEGASFFFTLP